MVGEKNSRTECHATSSERHPDFTVVSRRPCPYPADPYPPRQRALIQTNATIPRSLHYTKRLQRSASIYAIKNQYMDIHFLP